jgi:hypothetical protein
MLVKARSPRVNSIGGNPGWAERRVGVSADGLEVTVGWLSG